MEAAAPHELGEPHTEQRERAGGIAVSIESLLWIGLIAAAAGLRLADLGALPFTLGEAERAVDAMRVADGDTPDAWRGDLAAALTSMLFRLFGESEVLARLLPATAGAGVVAILWFARGPLGRVGAITAALLIAFSPLAILFARSALPFTVGSLLAVLIVVSLFAYLREPRPWVLFPLAVGLALAPLTDAVAVSAALAVVLFVAVEAGLFSNPRVTEAWNAFRRDPLQWAVVVLLALAALQLGFTRFGTGFDRLGLPGLELWADMFESAADGRAAWYHFALLLGYDWQLLVAGGVGFLFLALRFTRGAGGVHPFHRFLLLWALLAAFVLLLAAPDNGGALLIVLLPLAFLAGALVEEAGRRLDWEILRRWWPAPAVALVLAAYAGLLATQWASPEGAVSGFQILLAFSLFGIAVALSLPFLMLGARAVVVPAVAVSVLAAVFMVHSSLAVAFSEGAEPAADARALPRAEQFRDVVSELSAEAAGGTIVVDMELFGVLGWHLRDLPVVYGAEPELGAVYIAAPEDAPANFTEFGDPWTLAEGWHLEGVGGRGAWRWILYREPYSPATTIQAQIYVPTI